ncbi:PREDICTED: allergen Asp f 7 homolog [Dinoponera quadriceps]|uniref:Allergen Asp f 7 homolog n=1 Tax=Dinoponera quadriceps TaxID=609295 RepID=A0A6P3XM70_DINQU|nr:PREDICTED: allergen Asp f 7 homolog [Dinoponera quadriceps]
MVFMEESELSSKRWASAPRRPDSPCVLGAPTSREAAGPPVQLEPVDLSVKTPVVLQVPRYSPAAIITAAARRVPSPSTTPTPPPPPPPPLPPSSLCVSTDIITWRKSGYINQKGSNQMPFWLKETEFLVIRTTFGL